MPKVKAKAKETTAERNARKAIESLTDEELAYIQSLDARREPTPEELAEKEMRGRDNPDHSIDRVRPDHPERPEAEPFDEEAKRRWKEARNQHPGPISAPKIKDPLPKPEPVVEPSPAQTRAKERRGLVRVAEFEGG